MPTPGTTMPPPPEPPSPAPEADLFLVGATANRLPDGGPRYLETPPDPYLPGAPFPAEPWNTVTASFFVLIVVWWTWRLWGRFGRYPFITACLPVLLAGGVGGTLYHATRTQKAFFLLDVIPISLLGMAGSVYLTYRLTRRFGPAQVVGSAVGFCTAYVLVNLFVIRAVPFTNPNMAVNLSYASLAVVLLLPVGVTLVVTRFRHAGWVAAAVACFGHAWFCRLVDNTGVVNLPMGTHWLWHTYGALTTVFITEYFYRVSGDGIGPGPGSP